jgi:hypothetical protein
MRMSPLILLVLALAGAVLLQAFIRAGVAPHHRWVAVGRPRIAIAKRSAETSRVEATHAIGEWENEGGARAVAGARDIPSAPRRAGSKAAEAANSKPEAS